MGANKIADRRLNVLPPARAVEDAVVAGAGLDMIGVQGFGQIGTQVMGGLGLADAGDVILFALDGEEGRVCYRARIDETVAVHEGAAGQVAILKDDLDRLKVKLLGQIHHREILIIKVTVFFG